MLKTRMAGHSHRTISPEQQRLTAEDEQPKVSIRVVEGWYEENRYPYTIP